MQIRWEIMVIIGCVLIVLLVFVIVRNREDKEEFEDQLKRDYEKPKQHEDNQDTKV